MRQSRSDIPAVRTGLYATDMPLAVFFICEMPLVCNDGGDGGVEHGGQPTAAGKPQGPHLPPRGSGGQPTAAGKPQGPHLPLGSALRS